MDSEKPPTPPYACIFKDCAEHFQHDHKHRNFDTTIHIHSTNCIELDSGEHSVSGEYKVGEKVFRNIKYRVFTYNNTALLPPDKKSCWSRVYEWFNGPPDVQIVRVTFDMT
jgi:hypothetical protein